MTKRNVVRPLMNEDISGADLLILQQEIKQYVAAKQTRELTLHEQDEFIKLKEKLVPALLRYTQPQTNDHMSVALTTSTSTASRQSAIPEALEVSTTRQSQATTSRPKRTLIKQEPLHISKIVNGPHSIKPTTWSAAKQEIVTAKKGVRRLEIYHDENNNVNQSKGGRVKSCKKQGGDSDKENRDPSDVYSSKQNKGVLGEITNNTKRASVVRDFKGKAVQANATAYSKAIDAVKSSSEAADRKVKGTQGTVLVGTKVDARAISKTNGSLPSNATDSVTKNAVKAEKHYALDPALQSATVKRRKVASATEVETSVLPKIGEHSDAAVEHTAPILDITNPTPVRSASPQHQLSSSKLGSNAEGATIKDDEEEGQLNLQSLREAEHSSINASSTGVSKVTEIPGSVEEDVSTQSLGRTSIKQERETVVAAGTTCMVEYEEIPDSQESQYPEDLPCHHESEELTLPQPDFLCGDQYEEIPDSQGSLSQLDMLSIHSSLEPTLPQPSFLLVDESEKPLRTESCIEHATNGTKNSCVHTTKSTSVLNQDRAIWADSRAVSESTDLTDGVWCIDDFRQEIASIVCGHREEWITVEAASEVQFWQLQNDDDAAKSRWHKRYCHKKSQDQPYQIIFAPDDSFAVLFHPEDSGFFVVQLDRIGQHDDAVMQVMMSKDVKPTLHCKGFIMERNDDLFPIKTRSDTDYVLVLGGTERGSIYLVPIPQWQSGVFLETIEVDTLSCSTTHGVASSLVKIKNTSSLILVSFGTKLVLWDLCEGWPVYSTDVSTVMPGHPSCVPTASWSLTILSATVPAMFNQGPSAALYPVLAVLRICTGQGNDYVQKGNEGCALYVMRDGAFELIHKYQGSNSISSASSSCRFVVGQRECVGEDKLYLWDITRPIVVAQMSLQGPPCREHIDLQRSQHHCQVNGADTQYDEMKPDLREDNAETVSVDLFSNGSTLSSPPVALSDSFEGPGDDHAARPLASHGQQVQRCSAGLQAQEWIDLTSVSWGGQKETQFSVHPDQRWVVVAQQDRSNMASSAIHILDMLTLLPAVVT
ncbi:hypothetical protein BGX28_002434 [Mortierella sp. GBA30]|nr:hypothetical protein BGX28_002434 [Mortierella sp. GBA30]